MTQITEVTDENLYLLLLTAYQAGIDSTTSDYNAEDYPTASNPVECLDNFEAWMQDEQPALYSIIFP